MNHEKRYLRLLEQIKSGTLYKRSSPIQWKCTKCGRVHEEPRPRRSAPPARTPGWFMAIEANF